MRVQNFVTLRAGLPTHSFEQLTLAGLDTRQMRDMESVISIPENVRRVPAPSTPTRRAPDTALYPASSSPAFRMVPSAIDGIAAFDIPHDVDTSYLGHGYFRYIGKYPPQLVSYVLNKYAPEPPILDAMCGGGTTLIEARLRGFDATGCDVNPVARLVSRVVSHPLPPEVLAAETLRFMTALADRVIPESSLFFANRKPSRRDFHLNYCAEYFDERTTLDIGEYLALVEDSPADFRDLHLMNLLAVLRRISRANIKKMNLEIDDTKNTKQTLIDAIRRQVDVVEKLNAEYFKWACPCAIQVLDRDAANTELPDRSFGIVFLHPPYLTNTAFSEFSQLQLAILGIDHKTIWRRELRCRGSFMHEPNGLKKYLVGWSNILKEATRLLRPGGLLVSVVGDGQIDYVRIPVGAITLEFAKDYGLACVEHFLHVLNNNTGRTQSRKMIGQHVAVFRKER